MRAILIFLCFGTLSDHVLAGLASYSFTSPSQPANLFSRYTALWDIDGDGQIDIITADSSGILVTPGNGDGTFRAAIRTPLMDVATAFAVADVDGDGRPDLVVFSQPFPASSTASLTILLGLGNGNFRQTGKYSLTGPPININIQGANPVALADFDQNGLPDIAIYAGGTSTDNVAVLLNQGNGTFGSPFKFSTGTLGSNTGCAIASGDFNNDGNPDIAIATGNGNRVAVILGDGGGNFGAPLFLSVNLGKAVQLTNLALADLNGDGKLDLITAQNWPGVPGDVSVGVYLGRGDGTFNPGVLYAPSVIDVYGTISVNAGALLFADFTGDGIPDMVTSNYRANSFGEVAIFPGNGDGTFQQASVYQTTAQAYAVSVSDLNNDGRMDLVITSPSTTTQLSAIQVMYGGAGPYLRTQITSNGPIYMDQPVQFSAIVKNLGDAPTSGQVTMTPGASPPGGIDPGTAPAGSGWNCGAVNIGGSYGPQCSRNDSLAPGASYPALPIPGGLTVLQNILSTDEIVAGGGSARTDAQGSAQVIPLNGHCPFVISGPNPFTVSRLGGSFNLSPGAGGVGCPLQITSNVAWITPPNPSVSFIYTIASNTTGVSRTGTLTLTSITGWSGSLTIVQSGQQCLYQFDQTPYFAPASQWRDFLPVTVEDGCPIDPSANANWISVGASGPSILIDLTANTGPQRQATLTAANLSRLIVQSGNDSQQPLIGGSAHWAVGGGWATAFEFVNASSNIVRANSSAFTESGTAAYALPFEVDNGRSLTGIESSGLANILLPHASAEALSGAPGSALLSIGSAQWQLDPGASGFVRFQYVPSGQEALVPTETRAAKSFTVGFDNTNGITTGIAVAVGGISTNIAIAIRDDTGALIDSGTVSMNSLTHDSYTLPDRFPKTAGRSGTIQFTAAATGQFSVVGIRFPPNGRFSSIPPASEIDAGSGILPQLVAGQGWSTTVEVINTQAASSSVQLSFVSTGGIPLTLPLTINGTTTTSSQLQQTIAPHGRLVVNISNSDTSTMQVGSARLTSSPGVSGFLRYSFAGQDAVVPLETRHAANYVVAFDNTGGASTGIAIVNASSVQASIPVTIYDRAGNQLATDTVVLPAQGQTAYVLGERVGATANKAGSAQFTTPAGGSVAVLGIRYPSSGAFTTVPIMTP